MVNFFTNCKVRLTALALTLVTLFSLIFAPLSSRRVMAESIRNLAHAETLFSNGNMTEAEIEAAAEDLGAYRQYLQMVGSQAEFRLNIPDESALDADTIEMIQANVDAMNYLDSEGVGYINSDFEFVFTETDDYFEQFAAWGFRLRWNRMWASFDKEFAMVIALFFLTANIHFCWTNRDPRTPKTGQLLDVLQERTFFDNVIETAKDLAREERKTWITGAINYLTADRTTLLFQLCTTVETIITSSSIFSKVMGVVLAFIMPSISDCFLIFYNGFRFNAGIVLTVCWIPTRRDSLGVSIKTLV